MKQNIVPRELSRILIISLGSLGDILISIAAIEAIRNYHTDAHIILLTEPFANRLFDNCPYIDEIHTNHRPNGFKEDFNVASQLQKARLDMVYDLSCNEETEAIFKRFWLQKPKWSGIVDGCSHPHIDIGRNKIHPLDRHCEQLWLCGIGPKDGYPIGSSPLPNIDWILSKEDAPKYSPKAFGIDYEFAILLLENNEGEQGNTLPSYKYVALGNSLVEMGYRPIIIGSHEAGSLGNEIRAGINGALDLVGRIDILSFISLAKHSNLIVGSSGDLSILAALTGAPLVSLINPIGSKIRQIAPRGEKCVSLVAKDFTQIEPSQILQAARAVL